jgi:uncharacterized linocin/CFP29 family protein
MNHLYRELAPISEDSWSALELEATTQLTTYLAARKLVDFVGPLGWTHSASNIGRVKDIAAPNSTLAASLREVRTLAELRAPFEISQEELRSIDRGGTKIDFDALDRAALAIAQAENAAVLAGWSEANISGIAGAAVGESIPLGTDYAQYPKLVASAVERLHSRGIGGPYGIALSPESYLGVVESTEHGGLIVFDHLREILGGPIVRTPGITGAVVMTLRGGDFVFEVGQDLSIGYHSHDADSVQLYFEESFTFKVDTPEAAVILRN